MLVFCTLGEEKKALAGLGGMSSIAMGDILCLFIANIGCEVLRFKRTVTEPEVFFGKDETPWRLKVSPMLDSG